MVREAPSSVDVFSKRRSRAAITSLAGAFVLVLVLTIIGEAFTPGAADRQPGHNSWSYGAQGFRGLYEVLETLGYQVERHRRTYRALPPAEDSVLLSLDPGSLRAVVQGLSIPEREDAATLLRGWVEAGGRLIITRPGRWMFSYGGFEINLDPEDETIDGDLEDDGRTGDSEDTADADELPFPSAARRSRMVADLLEDVPDVAPHSLRDTMKTLRPLEEFTAAIPDLTPGQTRALGAYLSDDGASIDLFSDASDGGMPPGAHALVTIGDAALALEYEIGEGRVILLSTAFPFSNGALKWTPTAEVVTQLVRFVSQGGRRRVFFDEFTHGFYRKSGLLRWARETELFYPLTTALIGILLGGWYGAIRFGPPRPERAADRRAREEFVLSLGDMYRRGQHYQHALALIVEAYETRIAQLLGSTGAGALDIETSRAPGTTRFSYRVPTTEREFLKVARRLHEEYLTIVNTVRGKKTPRNE